MFLIVYAEIAADDYHNRGNKHQHHKPRPYRNVIRHFFIFVHGINKTGAVSNSVTTYPGLGAIRIAMVFAAINAAEKLTI